MTSLWLVMSIIALGWPQGLVAQNNTSDAQKWDVIILVDASLSMRLFNFRTVLEAILTTYIEKWPIGEDTVRVGLIAFSTTLETISLTGNLTLLREKVPNIYYEARQTNTHVALEQADTMLMSNGRSGVNKAVLLFTNGNPRLPLDTYTMADRLRSNGVTVYATGLGTQYTLLDLAKIAGDLSRISVTTNYSSLPFMDLGIPLVQSVTSTIETTPSTQTVSPVVTSGFSSLSTVSVTSSTFVTTATSFSFVQSSTSNIQSSSSFDQSSSSFVPSSSSFVPSSSSFVPSSSSFVPSSSNFVESLSSFIQPSSIVQSSSSLIQPSSIVQSSSSLIQPSSVVQSSSSFDQSSSSIVPSSSSFVQSSSSIVQSLSSLIQPSSFVQSSSSFIMTSSFVQSTSSFVQLSSSVVQSTSSFVQSTSSFVQLSSSVVQSASSFVQSTSSFVQLSSSVVLSTSTFVQSSSSFVQSSSSIGQSSSSIGQPSSSIGQPSSSIGQPSSSIGQPSSSIGQPSSSIGQPSSSIGQPSSSIGPPSSSIGQPSSSIGQPSSSIGPPSSSIGQPSSSFVQPSETSSFVQPTPSSVTIQSTLVSVLTSPTFSPSPTLSFPPTQLVSSSFSSPHGSSSRWPESSSWTIHPTTTYVTPSSVVPSPPTPTKKPRGDNSVSFNDSSLDAGVCRYSEAKRGFGFAPHPYDCDKYFQCHLSDDRRVTASIRYCPRGLFWSQERLTCVKPAGCSSITTCRDPCEYKFNGDTYKMDGGCGLYWECYKGVSIGRNCDPDEAYIPGQGCVYMTGCPYVKISSKSCDESCEDHPLSDLSGYTTELNIGQYKMPCLYNTKYDIASCTCKAAHFFHEACPYITRLEFKPAEVLNDTMNGNSSGGGSNNTNLDQPTECNGICVDHRSRRPLALSLSYRRPYHSARQQEEVLVRSQECSHGGLLALTEDGLVLKVRIFSKDGLTLKSSVPLMGFNETEWRQVNVEYSRGEVTIIVSNGQLTYTVFSKGGPHVQVGVCGWLVGDPGDLSKNIGHYTGEIQEIHVSRCFEYGQ